MFIRIGSRQVDLRIALGVAAMAVVAGGLLTLALSRRSADNRDEGTPQTIGDLYAWVTADMLFVPDELAVGNTPRWVPYRERRERWSSDDVDEYWLDPQEIGIDILSTTVHEEITQLLEAFP